MPKYEIILYWSDEDQTFIAEVPELTGCAADGATRQEALTNVEIVIAEWLESAHEPGRPIPRAKGPAPIRLSETGRELLPSLSSPTPSDIATRLSGQTKL